MATRCREKFSRFYESCGWGLWPVDCDDPLQSLADGDADLALVEVKPEIRLGYICEGLGAPEVKILK